MWATLIRGEDKKTGRGGNITARRFITCVPLIRFSPRADQSQPAGGPRGLRRYCSRPALAVDFSQELALLPRHRLGRTCDAPAWTKSRSEALPLFRRTPPTAGELEEDRRSGIGPMEKKNTFFSPPVYVTSLSSYLDGQREHRSSSSLCKTFCNPQIQHEGVGDVGWIGGGVGQGWRKKLREMDRRETSGWIGEGKKSCGIHRRAQHNDEGVTTR
ncbi:hypothetical protein EYF80_010775 [Liparis tanakae]|uniref:Uncharacterized protein n=1 Tax=Liparis tanakae TaxID=230148 RepID=A0A4Z2IMH0_9TELE|nr:hypothetical protein EYF80_010775 [Liparis tanakae]